MTKSIYGFLKEYSEKDIYPFHMPGHKRNARFIDENLLNMDITEINGSDNLHNPKDIIKNAQDKIASAYGASQSYMLVNGSTSGIIAAIMSICTNSAQDEILISRNSHISAYNGLVFSGATPHYVYPEITAYNIPGGVNPAKIDQCLQKHPNIKGVLITSPTYEGFCSDIGKISEIVHKHNKILIVDEAHGAHFGFHDFFPETAVKLGADIVIQSFHKTLPALNQSSVLHLCSERVDTEILKTFVLAMQTTSPSYILLGLMEKTIDFITQKNPNPFNEYVKILKGFRESVNNLQETEIIGDEIIGKACIHDYDKSKLVFHMRNPHSLCAKTLAHELLENHKVEVEMFGLNHLIALTSVADEKYGFDRLRNGLYYFDKELRLFQNRDIMEPVNNIPFSFENKPSQIITPRAATYSRKTKVHIKDSVNNICAAFITPYPPGIPLIAPGEAITKDIVNIVSVHLDNGTEVLGIDEGGLIWVCN